MRKLQSVSCVQFANKRTTALEEQKGEKNVRAHVIPMMHGHSPGANSIWIGLMRSWLENSWWIQIFSSSTAAEW